MKIKKRENIGLVYGLVIILSMLVLMTPMTTYAASESTFKLHEELNSTVINELQEINFSDFDKIVNEFNANKTNIFSLGNIKNKVYSIISGEDAINYENFLASLFSNIISAVVSYLPIMSIIVAIGVISNMLNGIKSKFNEKSTSNLIHTVCFLCACILIIGIIKNLSTTTSGAVTNMVNQMNLIFPILLTLMVGLGANASVGAFQPIVAILSTYIADIFNYFILPLFMFSFIFGIISNLSVNVKLDKFSGFISSLFKWSVGIIFTLFFAIFTIQGITAGSFDSVSIRTTKYTIKSYVPVMGGYLSDGMDLILASTILVKNSVGLVGILILLSTILSPLLEILIFSLLLKFVSAVLQSMNNNKVSNFLSSTSKSITILSTSIIAIGFMYLISVGLIMMAGNVVV